MSPQRTDGAAPGILDVRIDAVDVFLERHAEEQERLQVERPSHCMTARLPPYLPTSFHQEIVFSIERQGEVVALAGAMLGDEPDVFLLSYVTVDPRHRRQGMGGALIDAMITYIKDAGLRILETGPYSKMGETYMKKVVRRHAGIVEIREQGVAYKGHTRNQSPR
jgi:GNAT superfamily N-acetyltransferase